MKKSETTNTFEELIMDLHPLETPKTVYTNALNATIVTRDGNEGVLLNDMGNGRIETAYLPEGYIPLGTCSLGGIIYVASYNPLTDKGLIGCFPSPERNVSSDEVTDLDITLSNNDFKWYPDKDGDDDLDYSTEGADVYYLKKGLFQEGFTFNPGDKFIVYGNPLSSNFEKLWIEEEYADFFTENTEPLWKDEEESELEELVDYDKDELKDKNGIMEHYSKPIITVIYDIVGNSGNAGNIISPSICIATQIYTDSNGKEKEITRELSDEGAFSFSIKNCNDGVTIDEKNGNISGIGASVSHIQEIIGTVTVTVTMNGIENSAKVNIILDAMNVKSISLLSIEGTIGYSRTDGDVGSRIIKTDIVDGEIFEELYAVDTIDNEFDFSNVIVNISADYKDGTEPYITTCTIESIDIEQSAEFVNEGFTSIITDKLVATIKKLDYSELLVVNNFYGLLTHMIDNYSDKYSTFKNVYEDKEEDEDLTEKYGNKETGNIIYDYFSSTTQMSVCTLKLNCVFGGLTGSFKINVNIVPQYLYHVYCDENTVYFPSSSEEYAGQINTNVTNLSLGDYKNDDLSFYVFFIKNFPRVYSGNIINNNLPFEIKYATLGITETHNNNIIFSLMEDDNDALDWNYENAMECTGEDYDNYNCVIKDDLNDTLICSQKDDSGIDLGRVFIFNFIDDEPNSHN